MVGYFPTEKPRNSMNTLSDFGGDSLHLFDVRSLALMQINAQDGAIMAANPSALLLFDGGNVKLVG
jgi:hypothetical protein